MYFFLYDRNVVNSSDFSFLSNRSLDYYTVVHLQLRLRIEIALIFDFIHWEKRKKDVLPSAVCRFSYRFGHIHTS